ncbi:MAG: hypothetical protein IPH23_14725 [Gammaproteobacteria bacterium]|nr:hypothetical protein [Gammaproteobacteria bacterium]
MKHLIETRLKRIVDGYDWVANCNALKGVKQPGHAAGMRDCRIAERTPPAGHELRRSWPARTSGRLFPGQLHVPVLKFVSTEPEFPSGTDYTTRKSADAPNLCRALCNDEWICGSALALTRAEQLGLKGNFRWLSPRKPASFFTADPSAALLPVSAPAASRAG